MRFIAFCFFLVISLAVCAQPVFKNPGLAAMETYELTDFISYETGYVVSKITVSLKEINGKKFYNLHISEGNIYVTDIEVCYDNLTTVSEKRVDLRKNCVVESYTFDGNNTVHFHNKEKKIDKNFTVKDKNIYSRYALFFSLSGFPFEKAKSVTFKTYMFEYGDALTLRVTNVGKQKVTVKAGTYDCYKMELSIAGWQSLFACDTYYLYFAVASPHHFVKYEEKYDDGKWRANELIRITNMVKWCATTH